VLLNNSKTGDLGMTLSEDAGGLLGALGLTSGFTSTRGKNAEFSIDGGPTLISNSNTLDSAMLGVTGLSVTVDSATTQTLTVASDTGKMRSNIDDFIKAYNEVQTYIDEKSKVTTVAGKVTTSILSSNRDVQQWGTELRRLAFGTVGGVGSIDRLDDLGIDLNEAGQMSIKDTDKLTAALTDHGSDVEAFFTTASTGFAAKFDERITKYIKSGDDSQDRLTATNKGIDQQIADMQRRLDQQRALLTSSFIAMESAQSRIQQQSSAITNAFGGSSNSK
jgi:flagellar hook-associated protein 2